MRDEEKNEQATRGGEPERDDAPNSSMSIEPGVSVPPDSNIVGGGAPGESVDMTTASGPSDSGGG